MFDKLSRRGFIKLVSGTSLLGFGTMVTGCGKSDLEGTLQGGGGWMPESSETSGKWKAKLRGRVTISPMNPAIMRVDEKCILCGQCAEVCEKVMSVHGHYPLPLKAEQPCVHCGQCTIWCPTGAIRERDAIERVREAIRDPEKHVVVQTAPSTKISLGELFDEAPGALDDGKVVAALRRLGFAAVFDTCNAADITIMEEAAEALERLRERPEEIPHFTSCCPGWVKFCEYFFPEEIRHLSTAKSPQQILGAAIKDVYAREKAIAPEQIVSVAVMPCTAKKFEARREEIKTDGFFNVDLVLTVRELGRMLKDEGITPSELAPEAYDPLFGESTDAGRIFGASGGVAEASVRTLYYMATGMSPPESLLTWRPVRGLGPLKEASVAVPGVGTVRVAVCQGLHNARVVMDAVHSGKSRWDFIEFMACPGGCIGGGGQPRAALSELDAVRKARIAAIYAMGKRAPKHASYENEEVEKLYAMRYEKPLSKEAEHAFHTTFIDRSGDIGIKEG